MVNAFASTQMEGENNIVITHELLHTFGATDKYDFATNRPRFPEGYAEPHANPLYPPQDLGAFEQRLFLLCKAEAQHFVGGWIVIKRG